MRRASRRRCRARSSSAVWSCVSFRDELDVQVGETAEQVRGQVLVLAVARRTVLRLGDGDVGGAVEEPVESDPAPGPGERCAGTEMRAVAERHVPTGGVTFDVEDNRLSEHT